MALSRSYAAVTARRRRYGELRDQGASKRQAAEAVGISAQVTAWRYEQAYQLDLLEMFTARQERIQVLAEVRQNRRTGGGKPVAETARQAAERLGVTPRTIQRYRRELAEAG